MKVQLTEFETGNVSVFDNPVLLRHEILRITDSPDEADDVVMWSSESAFGTTQYDHEKFSLLLIGY